MLEEYGPDNDAADAFSILPPINSDVTERNITSKNLAERYCADKLDG